MGRGLENKKNHILLFVVVFLIVFFIGSAIYGQYINYSPVPVLDYWSGVVDFYIKSMTDPQVWWRQHNEHRIVFSKLLFWIDMHFLGGRSILLLPVNIALLLSGCAVMMSYVTRLMPDLSLENRVMLFCVIAMLGLSWMQLHNIMWGFQSMFLMVYLLPLLSFYLYAKAQCSETPIRWRALAVVLAVASSYNMINGLFAIPVLLVLCCFVDATWRRFLLILAFGAGSVIVFFVGYEFRSGVGYAPQMLFVAPLKMLKFTLAYLGNPVYWVFGSINAAIVAGSVAVVAFLFFFLQRKRFGYPPYALALLAFVGYVFASAALTAYGRFFFEIKFSASSRYTTPSLLMWTALLILLLAFLKNSERYIRWIMLAAAVLLLPVQWQAFTLDRSLYTPHQKAVAALSVQMFIEDESAKLLLSPFYTQDKANYFAEARAAKVSIFSESYPVNRLGLPLASVGGDACSGSINKIRAVESPAGAVAAYGQLNGASSQKYRYAFFGDAQGMVKGIAIAGRDTKGIGGPAGDSYFDGYLLGDNSYSAIRCVR